MKMFQLRSQVESQEYLNLCHKTIWKLYELRKETHKFQFKSQQEKNRLLNLIEEFIVKMNLSKSKELFKRDGQDLNQKIVNELRMCLIEQVINQIDRNHLIQITEEMNYKSESNKKYQADCFKKYFGQGYRQIICQFYLNQNAIIFATDGRVYVFSNNLKLIKKFINVQKQFSQSIHLKHSKQFLLRVEHKILISNNKLESQQILKDLTNEISFLIINEEESLIISGSNDKTIKFWKKEDPSWTCQQELITDFQVISLSLNSAETKLISCGNTPFILVVELQSDLQWKIIQKLKVDINGEYVGFISNNQFLYHPQGIGLLQMFNYQNESKQFIEGQLLFISERWNKQDSVHYFSKNAKALIINYGLQIYVYRLKENQAYYVHQIQLGEGNSFKRLRRENQLIVFQKRMELSDQYFFIQIKNKV